MGNRYSCRAAKGWHQSTLQQKASLSHRDPAIHLASARPARKASSHSRRNALLRRTAPYSTEYAYRRDARRYDKIRQAAVYAGWSHNLRPPGCRFLYDGSGFHQSGRS
eukprot:303438_1